MTKIEQAMNRRDGFARMIADRVTSGRPVEAWIMTSYTWWAGHVNELRAVKA